MQLGFIGTGEITSSIVTGLSSSGMLAHSIWLSPRNSAIANGLANRFQGISVASCNQEVLDHSDTIVIAVKPSAAITIVSEWSRTSWLQDATDIPWKRLASPLAIAELRGDNQMEWANMPDELKPVTIDDVISPVPMNPSCMSLSCRFQAVARTVLKRPSKEARLYLSTFYPTRTEA